MARKLGLTPRREEKIKPFEDLLIVQSDSEVGRRANVDAEIVKMYRFAHGFLKPGESAPAPTSAETKPTRKAAKAAPALHGGGEKPRHGGPVSALDRYVHLLGTMSDRDVARHAEVTPAAVAQYRRRRKIAAFEAPKTEPKAAAGAPVRRPSTSSLDALVDQIGKRPDAEVAQLAGLSRSAVTQYRKRRGIAAFAPKSSPSSTEARPAPRAATEPKRSAAPPAEAVVTEKRAAPTSRRAVSFIVRVRRGELEGDYLVVGSDVAAAAATAVRAVGGGGDVLAITRHLEALV